MSLPVAKGYCDLNIPSDSNYKELIKRGLILGYQTFAINVKINQNRLISKTKQQSKKAKLDPTFLTDFPEAPKLELVPEDYPDLHSKGKVPIILKR